MICCSYAKTYILRGKSSRLLIPVGLLGNSHTLYPAFHGGVSASVLAGQTTLSPLSRRRPLQRKPPRTPRTVSSLSSTQPTIHPSTDSCTPGMAGIFTAPPSPPLPPHPPPLSISLQSHPINQSGEPFHALFRSINRGGRRGRQHWRE